MSGKEDQHVYKSNALIEAQYHMTVAEQRVLLACISQVRRDKPITDEVMYSISVGDVVPPTGSRSNAAYTELAKAALRLKRREVWITEYPNGEGSRREVLVTGWVQSIRYKKAEGRVELRFSKDILPYLTQLSTQFTGYAYADVAKMTSTYAIRLYELVCQWHGNGKLDVSITWLREAFALEGKYPNYKDFKKRVIEPAIEQVNAHSPVNVSWEPRKTGKRVTHLTFTFKGQPKKAPRKRRAKPNAPRSSPMRAGAGGHAMFGIQPAVIQQYAVPGDSWEDAALRALEARRSSHL